MKFLNLLLIVVFVSTLSSCRKGEEDPFLSLRSRTNRLTGQWKLTKLSGYHEMYSENDEWVSYNFYYDKAISDEFNFYKTEDGIRFVSYFSFYECKMLIEKDNSMKVNIRAEGKRIEFVEEKGSWDWDSDTGKKKEYANLNALKFVYAGRTNYQVVKLTNKELKLYLELDESFIDKNNGPTNVKGGHTFEFTKVD